MINSHTLQHILLCSLLMILLGSCVSDEGVLDSGDKVNVKLTLELTRQTRMGTRSDAGVDDLNENVINIVDLFLYKKDDALANRQPVFAATELVVSSYNGNTHTAEFEVFLPSDKFEQLFPTDADTQCDVYIIANRPTASANGDNALPLDDWSVSSLKENTVLYSPSMGKRTQNGTTSLYSPTAEESFVMDGLATISRNGQVLTGSIPVERVASKISLVIQGIADEVTDENGVVWKSDKESVRLSFRRGSNRTKLGSTPTEYLYTAKDEDIFNVNAVNFDKTVGTSLTTNVPFYTYPTNWGDNEKTRSHFILVAQWVKKEDESVKQLTYYEINVNAAGTYTKRNTHYKIYQKIEVLGSTDEESAEVIYPCNYMILDWGNTMAGTDITDSDASMSKFRYLVVDETNIEMHNTVSETIDYFSSDPVKISRIVVKRENLSDIASVTETLATVSNPTATTNENGDLVYTINAGNRLSVRPVILTVHYANPSILGDRSYIIMEHNLLNDMSEAADYTGYTIEFDVVHQDNANYKETVEILQYPMLLVEAELNSNYRENPNNYNNKKGYVILNKDINTSTLGGANGISSNAGNKNPNRYIVSVTSLPEGTEYIIGDPRSSSVNNLNWNNNFSTATTMNYSGDTNDRNLKYYHPTENSSRTENMISPQFMVASSYGVTSNVTRDNAERRCASYQEDGYPAGRWRVPTHAEIEYLVGLSAKGVIPILFGYVSSSSSYGNDASYWSANSAVVVNSKAGTMNDATNTSSASVRCVYDLWYWTDKCDRTTFTWGDKNGGL